MWGDILNLKIMTFNVLNGWNTVNIGKRDDLAASVVFEERPDVIGFQEFDPCYRLAEETLSELIAERYEEAGDAHTTWNPIFYNKERFTLIESGEEKFRRGTVYDYPRGGRSGFRTVSFALLLEKGTGDRFILLNLHYDFNARDAALTAENQRDEGEQVVDLAVRLMKEHEVKALFVTGDYNAKISGASCVTMLEKGFIDTFPLAKERDDRGTCTKLSAPLWGNYENAAIDHVFYMGKRELRVNKYMTVESIRDASDHAPVLVTVEIN
jgi:endonuclease/exonuclease/phosphatase family metal-dependent hydrolase